MLSFSTFIILNISILMIAIGIFLPVSTLKIVFFKNILVLAGIIIMLAFATLIVGP